MAVRVQQLPETAKDLRMKVGFRGHNLAKKVAEKLLEDGASFFIEIEKGADYMVYVESRFSDDIDAFVRRLEKSVNA